MIQSKLLLQFKELNHFFFEKSDDWREKEVNNLITKSIFAEQVHGNKIAFVKGEIKHIPGVDGLVTDKNLFLTIRTADCLPIFFYDPKKRLIAAVHAGWKGLLLEIIRNTLCYMVKLGSQYKDIIVAIGPHIGVCCYQVSYKRIQKFPKKESSGAIQKNSQWFLDLGKIAFSQMTAFGIRKDNIETISVCTSCDTRFYSYRRDGNSCGRMFNVIGLASLK